MQINLLPWREQERSRKKLRFFVVLLAELLFAIIIIVILRMYYHHLVKNQLSRNKYLETVIVNENATVANYKKEKEKLILISNELNFIISLRDNSYDVVRALDELVRLVPEGVSFLSIMRDGKHLMITGKAKSDLQVTQFMENIAKSKIFQQPVLTNIASRITKQGEEQRQFQITVDQKVYSP